MNKLRLINDSELPGFCLEHHFGLGSIFLEEGLAHKIATCDLMVRDRPPHRNFLIAGGLEAIINFIQNLHYDVSLVDHLLKTKRITDRFADYLKNFSFSGDIYALPEGTVHFPGEPLLRVTAPIIEANLITDQLIALANIDTLLLSKFARIRIAAQNVKCGLGFVRAQGIDAAWRSSRNAMFFDQMGFSNVSSALHLGFGSTASVFNANHAFIKSFDDELTALRAAAKHFPDAISPMFDTYSVESGLTNVIQVADELKARGKRLESIVVDSGDLLAGAKYARQRLTEAGHPDVKIAVASNLDEYKIHQFLKAGMPADIFMIVTEAVTSADSPKLEMVYKTAQIDDGKRIRYTAKFSPGKLSLPGKKQVFRKLKAGIIEMDIIGL